MRAAVVQHRQESDSVRTLSDMAGLQHREQAATTELEKQVAAVQARLQPLRDRFAAVKTDYEDLQNALELKRAKDEAELDRLQDQRDSALKDVTAANPPPGTEPSTSPSQADETRAAIQAIEAEVAAQTKRRFEALMMEEEAAMEAAMAEREKAVKDKALTDCDAMMKQFKAEFRRAVQPQLDTLENAKSHLAAKRVTLTRQRDKLAEEVRTLQLGNALGDPAAMKGQSWLDDHSLDAVGASLLDLAQSPDRKLAPDSHDPSTALRHIHAGRRAAGSHAPPPSSVGERSEPASWVAFHSAPDFERDGTPNLAYYSVQPSTSEDKPLDVSMMGLLGSSGNRGERTDFSSVRAALGTKDAPRALQAPVTDSNRRRIGSLDSSNPTPPVRRTRFKAGTRATAEEKQLQQELGLADDDDDAAAAGHHHGSPHGPVTSASTGMAALKANLQYLHVDDSPDDADAVQLVRDAAEEADAHQHTALRELKLRVRHQWELLSGYDPADVITFLIQVHRKAPSSAELVTAYDTEFRRVKSNARVVELRASITSMENRYRELKTKSKGLVKKVPLFERELMILSSDLAHNRKELECATLAHQRTFKERAESQRSPMPVRSGSGWATNPRKAVPTGRSPAASVVNGSPGRLVSASPLSRFTERSTPAPAASPSMFSTQHPPSTINARSPSMPPPSDLAGFESF